MLPADFPIAEYRHGLAAGAPEVGRALSDVLPEKLKCFLTIVAQIDLPDVSHNHFMRHAIREAVFGLGMDFTYPILMRATKRPLSGPRGLCKTTY